MSARIPRPGSPRASGLRVLRWFALILATGALGACFPFPHGPYYRPSYPEPSATYERAICGGQVGPRSRVRIPTPDGFIRLDLGKDDQDKLRLSMSLGTSGLSKVQFTSDVVRITDLDTGAEWTARATPLRLGGVLTGGLQGLIPSTRVVDFTDRLPTAPENIVNDFEVWVPFSVDDFLPDAVRVQLPPIAADGREYAIPPLLWEADKEGKGVEGYEKGWGWWPYTDDKVHVDRFTVSAGVVGHSEAGPTTDASRQAPGLSGNVFVAFPAATKWRFTSDEIRFEDVGSGAVRQVRFEHLEIHSQVNVAFTSPFCCSRSAWMDPLPIGTAESKRLRVDMPALLINGKAFSIQPVTFERRRGIFEWGIYPFNC